MLPKSGPGHQRFHRVQCSTSLYLTINATKVAAVCVREIDTTHEASLGLNFDLTVFSNELQTSSKFKFADKMAFA
jgi:hypothetical protein